MSQSKPMKMTRQRRAILEEIGKVRFHPTADQIYELVRKRIPTISLGTVYRNLEILSEYGMIRKLDVPGTQRRFDGITHNHYHVRCGKCGKVADVPIEVSSDIEREAAGVTPFTILSHRLEFIGLCPDCAEVTADSDNVKHTHDRRHDGASDRSEVAS